MYADLSMQADLLKEALGEKWLGHLNAARWPITRWRDGGRTLLSPAGPCHGLLLARSIMPLLRGKSTYPGCSDFHSHLLRMHQFKNREIT